MSSENELMTRCAGVLLHITSLPGPFGIGDLGPAAYKFADFLNRTRQSIWQVLPLNPTDEAGAHSPYSSYSSLAGNPLLISPEKLFDEGWISRSDLDKNFIPQSNRIDFKLVSEKKYALLEKAYTSFLKSRKENIKRRFSKFTKDEHYWLQDFALYTAIKQVHENKPWLDWPQSLKNREQLTLKKFQNENLDLITKIKWIQFVFHTQWQDLKTYCRNLKIRLMGDLPFYVSYDSADVWAHRDIFLLNKEGECLQIAGVPPDYFNDQGQRWGMPIFNWTKLKKQRFAWWLDRIQKNLELTDLIRLDHFRAFSAYWSIPASEKTAIKGKWRKGPGADLFNKLKKTTCFVAEDLGDIDEPVHILRKQFELPGMKVLQFAFGNDMPQSIYIPHNYEENFVVYTGTHDNNTVRGWYRKEITSTEKKNLYTYFGSPLTEKNVHRHFIQLAYGSVARIAIVPIQDLLGLDETARMNTPATTSGNWQWRCEEAQMGAIDEEFLSELTEKYNRIAR